MSDLATGNHAIHCKTCGAFARQQAVIMGRLRVQCTACQRLRAGYHTETSKS